MKKVALFDLVGEKRHHWFYNSNVIKSLVSAGFIINYTSSVESSEKIKILEYMSINFRNIYPDLSKKTIKKGLVSKIKLKLRESVLFKNEFLKTIHSEFCSVFDAFIKGGSIKLILEAIYGAQIDECCVFHFLTLDYHFYDMLVLCLNKRLLSRLKKGMDLTGTLHWIPDTAVKRAVLKICLKVGLISKIIVHGDYIKQKVLEIAGNKYEDRITIFTYPMDTADIKDREECIEKLGLNNHPGPYLLCFGETRFDKGLDIMIRALKGVQEPYTLVIAGQEGEFSEEFIKKLLEENGIKDKTIASVGYVDDYLIPYYFSAADIVVLPYRRSFKGQSGPLTEAANYNKLIIAPDINQIGYTVRSNGLGELFEPENESMLAEVITNSLKNYDLKKNFYKYGQQTYKQKASLKAFRDNYTTFFNDFVVHDLNNQVI